MNKPHMPIQLATEPVIDVHIGGGGRGGGGGGVISINDDNLSHARQQHSMVEESIVCMTRTEIEAILKRREGKALSLFHRPKTIQKALLRFVFSFEKRLDGNIGFFSKKGK